MSELVLAAIDLNDVALLDLLLDVPPSRGRPRVKPQCGHMCATCYKEFGCASKLARHFVVHTGAREHGCGCGKHYSQRATLLSHQLKCLVSGAAPGSPSRPRAGCR